MEDTEQGVSSAKGPEKRHTRPLVFFRHDGQGSVEQFVVFPTEPDLEDATKKLTPEIALTLGHQLIGCALEANRYLGNFSDDMWGGLGK